jgi:hypothetical protein
MGSMPILFTNVGKWEIQKNEKGESQTKLVVGKEIGEFKNESGKLKKITLYAASFDSKESPLWTEKNAKKFVIGEREKYGTQYRIYPIESWKEIYREEYWYMKIGEINDTPGYPQDYLCWVKRDAIEKIQRKEYKISHSTLNGLFQKWDSAAIVWIDIKTKEEGLIFCRYGEKYVLENRQWDSKGKIWKKIKTPKH